MSVGGVMNLQVIGRGGNGAAVQHDAVGLDSLDVTHAHDLLDLAQQRDLALVAGCAAHHCRPHLRIDAQHHTRRVATLDQGVHEGQASETRTDHEVVGVDGHIAMLR